MLDDFLNTLEKTCPKYVNLIVIDILEDSSKRILIMYDELYLRTDRLKNKDASSLLKRINNVLKKNYEVNETWTSCSSGYCVIKHNTEYKKKMPLDS